MRTTDTLGRWGCASTDRAAVEKSALARARKLFADLSGSLEGEIDRLKRAADIESDESRVKELTGMIRQNQKALQTVLDWEARQVREPDKQRPQEGVIDLAEARAEISRRLSRLTG